jgi:hypothetical protein
VDITLLLDHKMLKKVKSYFIYKSEEEGAGAPVIGGLYILRQVVGSPPPATLRVRIDGFR